MGATVPDGPMAMEQLLLIRMMNQHRMLAMDSAAKAVLTPSQVPLSPPYPPLSLAMRISVAAAANPHATHV